MSLGMKTICRNGKFNIRQTIQSRIFSKTKKKNTHTHFSRAMDEPIEGGGSFDATGAFLGADDRITGDRGKSSDIQESGQTRSGKSMQKTDLTNASNDVDKDSPDKERPDSVRTNESEEKLNRSDVTDDAQSDSFQNEDKRDKELKSLDERTSVREEKALAIKHETNGSAYKNTSKLSSLEARETTKLSAATEKANINQDATPIDRLQEDIKKLIDDDDQSCNDSDEALLTPHLHAHDQHKHSTAGDVLAEKTKEIDRWFYRDPQGEVQGPFTATEMLEWYRAGYFDETLNVRRVCDPQFIELGDLLKACSGSIPFVSMPSIIPPLLQSQTNEIKLNSTPVVKPSTPTKPLANHLVHPKMPPPTSANNPPYFDILQRPNFLGLMNQPPNDFRKYFFVFLNWDKQKPLTKTKAINTI